MRMVENIKQENSVMNNNSLLLLNKDYISFISDSNNITNQGINKTNTNKLEEDELTIIMKKAYTNKEKSNFQTKIKIENKKVKYSMIIKSQSVIDNHILADIKRLALLNNENKFSTVRKCNTSEDTIKSKHSFSKRKNNSDGKNETLSSKYQKYINNKKCVICMYMFTEKNKQIVMGHCKHSFCKKCLKAFYEDKIERGEYELKCPNALCNKEISDIKILSKLISSELYERYRERYDRNVIYQNEIPSNISKYFFVCPQCLQYKYLFWKRTRYHIKCLFCMINICKYCSMIIADNKHVIVCRARKKRNIKKNCFVKNIIANFAFLILIQIINFAMTFISFLVLCNIYDNKKSFIVRTFFLFMYLILIILLIFIFVFFLPYFPLINILINFFS